ncbi:hypothetical protein NA78x_003326 [Anatilimnocola sp. NA78]|uniref:hypothetical protein n=1 Tax=Anatilimnocola sp. NA78 TaxID=3415683 RepID=UPI003CE5903A
MFPASLHRWRVSAVATAVLLALLASGFAEASGERFRDLDQRHTASEIAVATTQAPTWSLNAPSAQRVVPLVPAFGVVPVDVNRVPMLRCCSQSESFHRSRDSRHRIQRVERLLLLI